MRQHRLGYPAPDAQPCSYDGCTLDAEHFCENNCGTGYCAGHADLLTEPHYLCVSCENDHVRTVVAHGLTAGDFARRVGRLTDLKTAMEQALKEKQ